MPDDPVSRGTPRQATSQTSDAVADWLTKPEAADAIGRSTKAVERLVKAGKLQQAFRRQAGSADVAVYHPDDVARIAQERRAGPLPAFLVPGPAVAPSNGNGKGTDALIRAGAAAISQPPATDPGPDVLRVLVTAARQLLSETSQTPTPAYVPKPEALAIAGVSAGELRKAVQAGEVKTRGRRYRRTDLEQL